jgi:HK97 family phage portal protein
MGAFFIIKNNIFRLSISLKIQKIVKIGKFMLKTILNKMIHSKTELHNKNNNKMPFMFKTPLPSIYKNNLSPIWSNQKYELLVKEGYQKNIIVYRCVNVIARALGSVPFLVYDQHTCEEMDNHPLLKLLMYPNPRQAGSAFMEALVGYFLLSGNAYIEMIEGVDGTIKELHLLRPDHVKIIPGDKGIPHAFEHQIGSDKRIIPVDPYTGLSRILHLRNFHPLHDWYGMSPVEAASVSIDQHNTVSNHNLSILQNGGRLSGALIYKGRNLTTEQRQSLSDEMKQMYSGSANAGQIMVMEGDFEWKEMGLSHKDLDFIEGKNISAREIAQAFGVPPMLAGISGDLTYANYKEARLHFWEDTIIPLLEFIVSELNWWLTPHFSKDLILEYDHDAIPALTGKRELQWDKISKATFLTINEKREAVGYAPMNGGDVLDKDQSILTL